MYRGSRVRSPPVPVVLSVYQRGSLLDGLAMYLSCDTKKFHDNESTHILHNFGRPPIGGKLPPGGATAPFPPLPPLHSGPSLSLHSFPLEVHHPLNAARGTGERFRLPQWGLGRNRIWCILTLNRDIWRQQF